MVWIGLLGATLSFKTQSDAVLMESVFPKLPHIMSIFANTITSGRITILNIYFIFFQNRANFQGGRVYRLAAF